MTEAYTIDAAGQSLGRVASAVAKALLGKTSASYEPRIDSKREVLVTNASKMRIPERKRLSKVYTTYSGHPGGLKRQTLSSLMAQKGPAEVIRRAVTRMLPRNTTRTARLKRLHITT